MDSSAKMPTGGTGMSSGGDESADGIGDESARAVAVGAVLDKSYEVRRALHYYDKAIRAVEELINQKPPSSIESMTEDDMESMTEDDFDIVHINTLYKKAKSYGELAVFFIENILVHYSGGDTTLLVQSLETLKTSLQLLVEKFTEFSVDNEVININGLFKKATQMCEDYKAVLDNVDTRSEEVV